MHFTLRRARGAAAFTAIAAALDVHLDGAVHDSEKRGEERGDDDGVLEQVGNEALGRGVVLVTCVAARTRS